MSLTHIDCPRCAGTGLDPEYKPYDHVDDRECNLCGGSGELLPPEDDDAYDRKGDR